MSNIQKSTVRYPQKESAVAFVPADQTPFKNAVIGITYPYADYTVSREGKQRVTVFEYVLEGEGEILLGGVWRRAGAGDLYVLRQGEPHSYRANPKNPWKKIWINYIAEYISPFLDAYGIQSGIYRAETARIHFEKLFLYTTAENSSADAHLDIANHVHGIVQAIAGVQKNSCSPKQDIREALEAAVYEKLNLDELAVRLHMSKSNLIRIFKKHYGVTPYDYLISLKITTAKVLLKNTQMTVREISARLCFSDEHYFSSLFLSKTGLRPREYRKER